MIRTPHGTVYHERRQREQPYIPSQTGPRERPFRVVRPLTGGRGTGCARDEGDGGSAWQAADDRQDRGRQGGGPNAWSHDVHRDGTVDTRRRALRRCLRLRGVLRDGRAAVDGGAGRRWPLATPGPPGMVARCERGAGAETSPPTRRAASAMASEAPSTTRSRRHRRRCRGSRSTSGRAAGGPSWSTTWQTSEPPTASATARRARRLA